jgi:DNA-binding HxlR family transcriptional regulator
VLAMMDRKMIEEYLEKFPIEIREPIMALDTDQKWALFIALTLDKEMYFNEIKKVFNGNANTIDTNLKTLVASGLIAKRVKKIADIKNQEKTYYHATEFGKKFLYTLSDIGLPKHPVKTDFQTLKDEENYSYKSTIKPYSLRNFFTNQYFELNMKNCVTKQDYVKTDNTVNICHKKIQKAEV